MEDKEEWSRRDAGKLMREVLEEIADSVEMFHGLGMMN